MQGWLVGMGALFSGSIIYPLFQFMKPKEMDEGPSEVKLPLAECNLKPNTSKIFPFGHKPALLIMTAEGELVALSAVCTHFECTVHYEPGLREIECPCHKGVYDVYGKNIKGPPPRPLLRYEITKEADGLLISKPGAKKEKKK